MAKTKAVYISAIRGTYVKPSYAKANPKITVKLTVPVKRGKR